MGYLETSLAGNERIVGKFKLHWLAWVKPWACIGVVQALTSRRVLTKKGIISRKSEEILLSACETITVKQGVFGRLLNYGNVEVSGRGMSIVVIRKTPSPLKVKANIEQQVSKNHLEER